MDIPVYTPTQVRDMVLSIVARVFNLANNADLGNIALKDLEEGNHPDLVDTFLADLEMTLEDEIDMNFEYSSDHDGMAKILAGNHKVSDVVALVCKQLRSEGRLLKEEAIKPYQLVAVVPSQVGEYRDGEGR